MRRVIFIFLILLSMTIVAQARYLEDNVQYVEDRFIVKLWPNTGGLAPVNDGTTAKVSDSYLTSLNEKWSVIKVERLFHGPSPSNAPELDMLGYWRFWLAESVDLETVLSEFAGAPIVEHVEPVGIHRISYSPDDTYWSYQWYIRHTGGDHDIDAVEGWDTERGDELALLGIVDTGVQYSHPDLMARMWRNMDEVTGTPGYDDDGNGFVDDTVGYDWVNNPGSCHPSEDCFTADADPKDFNGHGTHCAGIAAAHTNNGLGVAGIAGGGGAYTGARIMALRAGWEDPGGYGWVAMDWCAQAIEYATNKGVCAINCSWGSSEGGGLPAAVDDAIAAGIVMCVAAGNDNSSTADYLGSRGDCIDVGGTDSGDNKYSWSNYGSWVDVSAPAVSIYSTYSSHYTNTYTYLSGTSMAAPCVVGEVGLLKSLYPAWDRDEIQPAIIAHVDSVWQGTGWDGLMGSGRINVDLALLSAGSITVTVPNGGEIWVIDDMETIQWSSLNYTGNVDISINRNYPAGGWDSIVDDTPDDGSHPWTVTGFTTTTVRIRVMGSTDPSIGDTSNANFEITDVSASITVTAPDGGETWYVNADEDITWTCSGVTGDVKIELDRTYPSGWATLYASTANDGVQSWTVTSPITSQARIRITSINEPSAVDVSDADFTIADPYLEVSTPNGGEVWTEDNTEWISWSGVGVQGNVEIELNRSYPSPGEWETLYAAVPFSNFAQDWMVTGPATTTARVRISSVSSPSITDVSDANFTIVEVSGPPSIQHDPLDDGEPGNVLVVALAYDDMAGVSMKAFHRLIGAVDWDSTAMSSTGNPDEFSATLSLPDAGDYEYYLRATDASSETDYTDVYDFQLYPFCGITIAYDNGSADRFNWAGEEEFRWAVRFTPPATPFILCGTRVGISPNKPDAAHTHFYVEVYDESGGLPDTLLLSDTTGSIGNVIGGLLTGQTHWADVVLRDGSDEPLVLYGDFFIAVGNPDTLIYEAFARDTTSAYSDSSFLYDGCTLEWYNENDTWDNCKIGNRLIRALGYIQSPPVVVVYRAGNDAELHWSNTGAPFYRIYSDTTPFGSYATLEGSASDTLFSDTNAASSDKKFYRVLSSTLP